MTFINEHRFTYGVEPICEVIGFAPRTYYDAIKRPLSARAINDVLIGADITRVFEENRRVYGVRKVWKQLQRENIDVGRDQVARLMKKMGLEGAKRGHKWKTTTQDETLVAPDDHVDRKFVATRPNQLWVADFTYCSTWQGMTYVAFVIDVYSRCIVGWSIAKHMKTEMVLDALEMALFLREHDENTIHHSDRGSQYLSIKYSERLADEEIVASVGTTGDSYDNALAESTIGLFKWELFEKHKPWKTIKDLELATMEWVYWFNTKRLHTSIGDIPPAEFEAIYNASKQPEQIGSK